MKLPKQPIKPCPARFCYYKVWTDDTALRIFRQFLVATGPTAIVARSDGADVGPRRGGLATQRLPGGQEWLWQRALLYAASLQREAQHRRMQDLHYLCRKLPMVPF